MLSFGRFGKVILRGRSRGKQTLQEADPIQWNPVKSQALPQSKSQKRDQPPQNLDPLQWRSLGKSRGPLSGFPDHLQDRHLDHPSGMLIKTSCCQKSEKVVNKELYTLSPGSCHEHLRHLRKKLYHLSHPKALLFRRHARLLSVSYFHHLLHSFSSKIIALPQSTTGVYISQNFCSKQWSKVIPELACRMWFLGYPSL